MLGVGYLVSLARRLLTIPIAIPLSAALSPGRLESEAGALGRQLGAAVTSVYAACAPRPPAPVAAADDHEDASLPEATSEMFAAPATGRHKHGAHPGKNVTRDSSVAGGIFVGKDTVLRLARSGVVPSGQPVTESATHPAGIALSGVGALGIGLTDGDILVEVEGVPVRSEAQVVGLVIGARSRRVEQMSAIVWRASAHAHPHEHADAHSGERWSLVVAMPYF
ncbi:MAG TPA: hypothetical protein VH062_05820 [Polyangiaceae bacterium]|jgi:hypothetical protein|nr:hypothetical protein [Polyangiaceae bacterium]